MNSAPKQVVFVCTGNTCRSPMAEHLYTRLSREAGLPCAASSAGTRAVPGAPLSRGAAAALAAQGLSSVAHRARQIDASILDDADVVYVMERAQRNDLAAFFPKSKDKLFVLREAAGLQSVDVRDPMGAGPADYNACASSIEEALRIIILREREHHAPNPR